jgi:hypothetical protein
MESKILEVLGSWRSVADAARTTVGMEPGTNEPTSFWKRKILLAEHSPIRKLQINWKWFNLKSWVSVHLVRHKFGIEHFVRTQRTDRTGINRDEQFQAELIEHECIANPQAIINISRKRLCAKASSETRQAWQAFLTELRYYEPELAKVCVPDCIYRGYCYEIDSCGLHKTDAFKSQLMKYREGINE